MCRTMVEIKIAPSMLSADFLNLGKDVAMVNEHADLFHLDVMDGTFVPNISYGFPVVEAVARQARRPLDVHLMIVHPEKYAEKFVRAGASMVSFHLEAVGSDSEADEILVGIRAAGAKAGLVINPDIPVERLFPHNVRLCRIRRSEVHTRNLRKNPQAEGIYGKGRHGSSD